MRRDFTHIDDVTRVVLRLVDRVPEDGGAGHPPARIYNVGNHHPEELLRVVELLEKRLTSQSRTASPPIEEGSV